MTELPSPPDNWWNMDHFEFYQSASPPYEWYWRYRAANHRVICRSTDGYTNRSDCLDSIKLVKTCANDPVVHTKD